MRWIAVLVFASFSAHAEMTITAYKAEAPNLSLSTKTNLAGIFQGLSWANVRLVYDKRAPLFCQPATLALNFENVTSMIDTYLAGPMGVSQPPDVPIGVIMLSALVDTFPCPSAPQRQRM